MVVRLATAALASSVDTFFGKVALGRSKASRARSKAESLDHAARMRVLESLVARNESLPRDPRAFFERAGDPGALRERFVRALPHGRVADVEWRSGYAPIAPESDVRERYLSRPANEVAHARLWLHDRPRPAVLLIHGYMGGRYGVEERAWPMRWLFDRLGLDLALPVLPHHGPRGERGRRPLFPSSDPRINLEGFRQAIFDLMQLARVLRERGTPVGVMGMSLGGYTSALMATADSELAFAVPVIPLASIADFARDGGRLVGTEQERREQHEGVERAHAPVAPLARPPLVAPERMRVIAGEADRITPKAHAERLAAHFQAPLVTVAGGHLLQLGRAEGFREVARMLRLRGVIG
ncbi:MAG: hypothetical protein IT378_17685 [Sandaracinaceae bacterium]|nr:hypothetical protein [Sandaracinaceae bacterium]